MGILLLKMKQDTAIIKLPQLFQRTGREPHEVKMDTKAKYTNSSKYRCLEYLKKNSVELYLAYCGKEACEAGHTYGPASRREYLLHYIISGEGSFTVNNTTAHLKQHDTFLIYPDEITTYSADTRNPWVYMWIAFDGTRASECLHYAGFSETDRIRAFSHEATLAECVDTMLGAHQLTYSNDLIRQSQLMYFLATLMNEYQAAQPVHRVHEYPQHVYIDYAIDFIEQNFQKNIKIGDLSHYIGLDRSYLTKLFKKILNISPQGYLLEVRMNKASALLLSTGFPVNQVAGMVGYSDALAFSKAFKTKFGVSPKAYRTLDNELVLSNEKYK